MTSKTPKIGITGGMGSGKSTVCKIFELLGIPVYYADDRAKWLMANDESLKKEIIALFEEKAYSKNGDLDRNYIASIVFTDKSLLQKLNEAVHPAVARDFENWNNTQKDVPYTLKEAALIFESGSYKTLDKVITVFTPEQLRIERLLQRDQSDQASIKARMSKQMPEEKKIELADFVIVNHNRSLIKQVLSIHKLLTKQRSHI